MSTSAPAKDTREMHAFYTCTLIIAPFFNLATREITWCWIPEYALDMHEHAGGELLRVDREGNIKYMPSNKGLLGIARKLSETLTERNQA